MTKFVGGRPAVQDSEITEIFYRPDPYSDIKLPMEQALMDIKGKGIVLSCLKKAEKGDALIIRLYNTSEEKSVLKLAYHASINSVSKVSLKEKFIESLVFKDNKLAPLEMNPKQILTLSIK